MNRVLLPGTASNRLLRRGLVALALVAIAYGWWRILEFYPIGVDLTIPLRAAERWQAGQIVYDSSAFVAAPGATQPFLYPPPILALVAPLLALPRGLVIAGWCTLCLVAAIAACRRLSVRALWWLPVIAWPPFAEGILGGNIQIVLFALFAFMFWRGPDRADAGGLRARTLAGPSGWPPSAGAIGAVSMLFKVSQPQVWLFVLRHRPGQALLAAGVLGAIAILATLATGLALWVDWIEQLRRATDPTWDLGGIALTRFLGPIGYGVAVLCAIGCLLVPRNGAGAWIGILAVIGSTSLHTFGLLFLVPAMLMIRREIALFAAVLIATFTYPSTWLAIGMVVATFVAGERFEVLREPGAVGLVAGSDLPQVGERRMVSVTD